MCPKIVLNLKGKLKAQFEKIMLESDIWTKEQVAYYLERDVRTITRYVKRRGLPMVKKKGQHPFFRRKDVERWVELNRWVLYKKAPNSA